jgi:pimeloyl-ACP methyl ester carboxylesterase
MGGMIVQEMAIKHQDRLLSLCSIMSTTGDREVGQASPEATTVLLSPPAGNREDAIARAVGVQRVIGSPGYPPTDESLRERAAFGYDRAFRPAGTARQLAAIIGSPDRTAGLGAVTVPTLVLHGEQDALVNVSGGKATAAAIPGAELVLFPGMGHDLPEALYEPLVDAIVRNAARAAAE